MRRARARTFCGRLENRSRAGPPWKSITADRHRGHLGRWLGAVPPRRTGAPHAAGPGDGGGFALGADVL